jgi:hypothetical protein
MSEIARRLNSEKVAPKYGEPTWTKHKIYELLRTMGIHKAKSLDSTAIYTSAPRTGWRTSCAPRGGFIETSPTS